MILAASGPLMGAAVGVFTNLVTAGWNWWLFVGLVVVVTTATGLVVASEGAVAAAGEAAPTGLPGRNTPARRAAAEPPESGGEPAPACASPPSTAEGDGGAHRVAVWGAVPQRHPYFVGREEMLRRLARDLDRGVAALVPNALYGLGGVGKTQLAVEYAHRNSDRYDLVWWIPAEQPTLVREAFSRLARRMGVADQSDAATVVTTVLERLRDGEPFRRWLLVFDNAEDPKDLAEFLPRSGAGPATGHVLVTSRNRTWSVSAVAVEVDVLDRAESVQLLRRRDQIAEGAADRLADVLGDLPLALDQAAAWLACTGMSADTYLRLLRRHLNDVLRDNHPSTYPVSVAAAWGVAFDGLLGVAPAAAQLLELCAFFGPEPISLRLLRTGARVPALPSELADVLTDDLRLSHTLRAIGRYSLARFDPERETIQPHRLVQAVLRERLPADARTARARTVHRILAAANATVPDVDDPSYWALLEELNPHVLPAGCIESDEPDVRQVVLDQARYLWVRGDNEGCIQLGERATECWHATLGSDDLQTLAMCRHLAPALRYAGRTAEALALNGSTVARLHAVVGAEHEQTLLAVNSYTADVRIAGDFPQAYELDLKAYAGHRRVFGTGHLATLRSANNLAVDLRMLGRYQEALALDRETFRLAGSAVGPDHLLYLVALLNLAQNLYGIGRYAEALDRQERVLAAITTRYGAGHAQTLRAARFYAVTLGALGHLAAARATAACVVDRYRHTFGNRNVNTIAALASYANILRAAGALPEAAATAGEAVRRARGAFGADHPFTLAYVANEALVLRRLGRRTEAAQTNERVLSRFRRLFDEDHPFTMSLLANVATDCHLLRDHRRARELSTRAYTDSRRVRGAEHPETLRCAANLVMDLRATGARHESRELKRATVTALTRALGPEHPETARARRGERADLDIEPPIL